MTGLDTEGFRDSLLEERRRVEHALATLRDEHSGSLDDEVAEVAATSDSPLANSATAMLGREIDYTLGENSGELLAQIDAALQRIADGTYGTCLHCGRPIVRERLETTPWAALCIDCKRQAEAG